jgi:hypothetical protein
MKYFLATYEILDGFHEYTRAMIIEAQSIEEAGKIAESQEHDVDTDETEYKYFDFGDGTTASENQGVEEISKKQMEFLEHVGLAYRK